METKGGFNQRRSLRKSRLISRNSNVVKPGNGVIKLPSNLKASILPPKNDLKQSNDILPPSQDIDKQREQPHSIIKNNPLNTEAISQTQTGFLCRKCHIIFNHKDQFDRHLIFHGKSFNMDEDFSPVIIPMKSSQSMLPSENDLKQSENTPSASHDIENQKEDNPSSAETISQIQSDLKRFSCPKCNAAFNDDYVLDWHLKLFHTDKDQSPRMISEVPSVNQIGVAFIGVPLNLVVLMPPSQVVGSQNEQPDSIIEVNPSSTEVISQIQSNSKIFQCPKCEKGFNDEHFLNSHLKSHEKSLQTDNDSSPKQISEKPNVKKNDDLKQTKNTPPPSQNIERRKEQGDSKTDDNPSRTKAVTQNNLKRFTCKECKKSFDHKSHYDSHMKGHLKASNRLTVLSCPDCSFSSKDKKVLLSHFTEHGYDMTLHYKDFDSIDEFNAWKDEISFKENVQYACTRKNYVKHTTYQSFSCHRDGFYKPRGKNLRKLKHLGTNKIQGHCPAQINYNFKEGGKVYASFRLTHIGHENEPKRLSLRKTEVEKIKEEILKGVPVREILTKIRNAEYEGGPKRCNFIKWQDVWNIVFKHGMDMSLIAKPDKNSAKKVRKSSNGASKKAKKSTELVNESAEFPEQMQENDYMIDFLDVFEEEILHLEEMMPKFELNLPEFKPDSDAKAWVAAVEIILGNDPPKGAVLIAAVANALRGEATRWLLSVIVPDMEWSAFRELFLAQYAREKLATFLLHTRTRPPAVPLADHVASEIAATVAQFEGRSVEEIATAVVLAREASANPRLQTLITTKEITTSLEAQKQLQEFSMRLPFTATQSSPNAKKRKVLAANVKSY